MPNSTDDRLNRVENELERMSQRVEKTHTLVTKIHRNLYGSEEAESETGLFGQVRDNRQNVTDLASQVANLVENLRGYQGEISRMIRDVRVVLATVALTVLIVGANSYYQNVIGGDSLWRWLGRILGVM